MKFFNMQRFLLMNRLSSLPHEVPFRYAGLIISNKEVKRGQARKKNLFLASPLEKYKMQGNNEVKKELVKKATGKEKL